MKGKYPNGLRRALKKAGIKAAELARLAETAPQNVHRLLNGERELTKSWAQMFAPHIPGVSPADLIFASDGQSAVRRVRLGDWVTAGKFAEAPVALEDDDEELNHSSIYEGLPPGDWIAFDVLGDSMNYLAPEGSRIFVDRSDRELRNGYLYVVALDGETTFKRFKSPPARLEPESTNREHQPHFFEDPSVIRVVGRVRKVTSLFD